MIKKLSKKLVLVFSLLAVFVYTVSSCYAYNSDRVNDIGSLEDAGIPEISKTNINTTYMYDGNRIGAASANYPTNAISWFDSKDTKAFYFKMHGYTFCILGYEYTTSTYSYVANSGVGLTHTSTSYYKGFKQINFSSYLFVYNNSLGWCYTPGISDTGINYSSSSTSICDFMSFYDNKLDIYCPNTTVDYFSVNTTTKALDEVYFDASEYVPAGPDLSFDYTLTGIKRGAVKLEITGLDSSLRMYGYVGVKNNYEIGDTFDGSSVSEYLRLLTIYSDNSDLNCTLYRGEELVYYILDSNNVILDIGYISEMAKNYFLYGFQVDNGVDFEFLKDGQVYWSDSLTFKYQLNNSTLLTNNSIVSSVDNYIKISNTLTNVTCDATVYLNDNEISTASVVKKNNLSSLSITVHSSYSEVDTLFNKNTSIYNISNVFLEGTDEDGNNLDFSRYSVRWSIPTWLELKQITLAGNNYSKYNGTSSYFSSVGSLSLDLKIYEIVDSHKAPFDITLEILNGNGDVVLTKVINSDTIVKEEVDKNENNVDKDDFEIIDSPNYTGGSNNYPGSNNIHNWDVNDFANYLGTNNTIFNFFWAFLNNMPTWISTPLSILLIGIVVITLYKAFRG